MFHLTVTSLWGRGQAYLHLMNEGTKPHLSEFPEATP